MNQKPIGDASDYVKLEDVEHIRQAPGMAIGSVKPRKRQEYCYVDGQIRYGTVNTAQGIFNLFLEGLANAVDNTRRTRRAGRDYGEIYVTLTRKTVTIKNGGDPIPIVMHEKEKVYAPTLIFGSLRTSSNYKKDRTEIGTNGYGSKLINIFSRRFQVSCVDASRGLSFVQTWGDAMSKVGNPNVSESKEKDSSVTIKYELDWDYFGLQGGYPDDFYSLILRFCADMSTSGKIPIHVSIELEDDVKFFDLDYRNVRDYARLYGLDPKNYIIHYVWPKGANIRVNKDKTQESVDERHLPTIELLIADTPDNSKIISFVNSLMTPDHGIHVDSAVSAVGKDIVAKINGPAVKSSKSNSEKNPRVTLKNVRDHVSMILMVNVVSPDFDSQSKTKLVNPKVPIKIDPKDLENVKNWDLVVRLQADLNAKKYRLLKATDGKKVRDLNCARIEDANKAGTAQSHKCIGIFVEGNSAANYAVVMIGLYEGKRDYIGIFIGRGKLINALKASIESMAKNKEVRDFKAFLGLRENVDYTIPKERKTLRYGQFMILTDADDDGKHIKGLIITFFRAHFPSLLKSGYVVDYRTPYLSMTKGKKSVKFFFPSEFETWKSMTPNWKTWTPKYFKGLGSSKKSEIIEHFRDPYIVKFEVEDNGFDKIDLAFGVSREDDRKRWITGYDPTIPKPEVGKVQGVGEFVDYELIDFSIACLRRHIPGVDGLNEARRKVLFTIINHTYNVGIGKKYTNERIGIIASDTTRFTKYHHGDMLTKVVTGMAFNFVGSNNLEFFAQESALGTRDKGGKDAAQARYTLTHPSWWIPYVFREEDNGLLTSRIDENKKIEPEFYLPVLPIHVINGVNGIATGFSTFIPNHHPVDVANWLLERISGKDSPKELVPWYRGFTGKITVIDTRTDDIVIVDDEVKTENGYDNVPDSEVIDIDRIPEVGKEDVVDENDQDEDMTKKDDDDDIVINDEDDEDLVINDDGEIVEQKKKKKKVVVPRSRYSMITEGIMEYDANTNTAYVTELPIGCWTGTYRNMLRESKAAGHITTVIDRSDDTVVYFEIQGMMADMVLALKNQKHTNIASKAVTKEQLRIVNSYGLGNMHLLNEKSVPMKFSSVQHVMEGFYQFRLPYYEKRRQMMIEKMKEEVKRISELVRFIRSIIDGKVVIALGNGWSRKISAVHEEMDRHGHDRKLLQSVNLAKCTEEEYERLSGIKQQKLRELRVMMAKTDKDLWKEDILQFLGEYNMCYGNDRVDSNSKGVVVEDDVFIEDEDEDFLVDDDDNTFVDGDDQKVEVDEYDF